MASQPINSNHIPAYSEYRQRISLLLFFIHPFKSCEHLLVGDCGEIFGILSPYFLHLASASVCPAVDERSGEAA